MLIITGVYLEILGDRTTTWDAAWLHMCFLCMWNSRDDANHYKVKVWLPRTDFTPGKFNVQHVPLVQPEKSSFHL